MCNSFVTSSATGNPIYCRGFFAKMISIQSSCGTGADLLWNSPCACLRFDHSFRSKITRREPEMDLTSAFAFLDSDSGDDAPPVVVPDFFEEDDNERVIWYNYLGYLRTIQRISSQGYAELTVLK